MKEVTRSKEGKKEGRELGRTNSQGGPYKRDMPEERIL